MDDKIYHGPAHGGPHFHSGPPGKPGVPGVSPKVEVGEVEDGNIPITVTDGYGQRTTEIPIDSVVTDERLTEKVDAWLDEHPEATTTVQDGSITVAKFHSSVVDSTLTQSGHPADAAAVGETADGLDDRLQLLEEGAPEIISTATQAWLDDHVTPTGSAVIVDNSLTQSGAAADAKVTGDEVRDLKSDLSALNEFVKEEVVTEKTGTVTVSTSVDVFSNIHLIDISIPSGTNYTFKLSADGHCSKYHLYANGSAIKYNCVPETEYSLAATADITWLSVYINKTDVSSNGDVTGIVKMVTETSNSIEERVNELESESALSDYLMDGETLFFSPIYEIGATLNNDGNATFIYKNFSFNVDNSIFTLRCDALENSSANISFYSNQYDSNNNLIDSSTHLISSAKNGIEVIPLANAATILFRLYASQTGGLTTDTAKFYNVHIFKSDSGKYSLKTENAPQPFAVPVYYIKDSYLPNKVNTIESLMKNANGNYDAFIFCTDQHWTLNAKQSPKLINYICQRLNIPRMFMGGDYADGINLNAYKAYRDAFNGKIYDVIGNHEYMNYYAGLEEAQVTKDITTGDIWAYINMHMTDAVTGDYSNNYYYVDNEMQKMRYIILSVYEDNGNSALEQFDSTRQAWFRDVALDLPNGYTAIVFVHYLFSVNYNTGEITQRETVKPICDIVDAYDGNGTIACLVAGHTHVDGMTTTSGGIPVFITTCDKCLPWEQGGVNEEPWITANRHEGTITEQAFDVVIVDKTNRLISFVRIGAPADNGTSTKLELRQQTY